MQNTEPELRRDESGLFLEENGQKLRADFTKMLPRIRQSNLNGELLVRAAKIKKPDGTPTAVDATAGFGEDSFLLAAAGFSVLLFERDPIIAALLADALARAASDPALAVIAARMTLRECDSIKALPALAFSPDVVLLDPMFPARRKSGLIKKKLQFIQRLEKPCEDEQALLQAAFDAHPKKIVVKRPLKGARLAAFAPDYSIKGNSVRYDCILPHT